MTGKQKMVLDYMRGNGKYLSPSGAEHLVRRGSFRSYASLGQVLRNLERVGFVEEVGNNSVLTDAGLRASEAA